MWTFFTLTTKICLVKARVFPVVMYGCESWSIKKEIWVPKNWCFWTVVLEKEISPEHSLEGLMLKLKLQYFGYLMRRTDSLENTLMLGNVEGWRRSGWQKMRWLDMSLSKLQELVMDREAWWLQSMGLQRVGHNWVTEWNWTGELKKWGHTDSVKTKDILRLSKSVGLF